MKTRLGTVQLLVFFSGLKELSDLLLGATNILVEDLGTIHNLGFLAVESLRDLSCDQSLTRARWTVEQNSFAVLDTVLLDDSLRIPSRIESSSEDLRKLLVKSSDAERVEANVFLENLLDLVADDLDRLGGVFLDVAGDN